MRRRLARRIAVVAAVVLGMGLQAVPAYAGDSLDRARRVADDVVGARTTTLEGSASIKGYGVRPGRVHGRPVDTLVARDAEGFAVVAVLHEGQRSVEFPVTLPPGQRLAPTGGGGYLILKGDEPVGVVEAPWARDVTGRSLRTHYSQSASGTLTQHVDTRGATFPIVADPRFRLGWHYGVNVVYVHYSWSEMWRMKLRLNRYGKYSTEFIASACDIVPNSLGKKACRWVLSRYVDYFVRKLNYGIANKRCLAARLPLYPAGVTMWVYKVWTARCYA